MKGCINVHNWRLESLWTALSSRFKKTLESYRELEFMASAIWYYAVFEKTEYDGFITKSDMVVQ